MGVSWEEVTTTEGAPKARSSHAIAAIGPKVYSFGGEHAPRVPIDSTLYAFDLPSRAWSIVPATGDIPAPRVGVTMATLGRTLFVFGGRDAEHAELNELFAFDTESGTWKLLTSGDASPPARSYHAMAADPVSGKVYIFGGCGSQGRLNDLWEFNAASGKWTQLPSPPAGSTCVPRGGAGLVAAKGSVWVLFGFCGHELADIHRFDLASETWEEVQPKGPRPAARSVCGVGLVQPDGRNLVVFGGEVDPSDLGHAGAGKFSGEVFTFNTVEEKWEKPCVDSQRKGPGPRGWFPVACVDGGLVLYGGNSESNDRLNDMFVLNLTQGCFVECGGH